MSLVRNLPQDMSLVCILQSITFYFVSSDLIRDNLKLILTWIVLLFLLLYHAFCYAIGHDDVTATKLMEIACLIVVSLIVHEEHVVSRHSVMTDETVQQMSVFVSPKRTDTKRTNIFATETVSFGTTTFALAKIFSTCERVWFATSFDLILKTFLHTVFSYPRACSRLQPFPPTGNWWSRTPSGAVGRLSRLDQARAAAGHGWSRLVTAGHGWSRQPDSAE